MKLGRRTGAGWNGGGKALYRFSTIEVLGLKKVCFHFWILSCRPQFSPFLSFLSFSLFSFVSSVSSSLSLLSFPPTPPLFSSKRKHTPMALHRRSERQRRGAVIPFKPTLSNPVFSSLFSTTTHLWHLYHGDNIQRERGLGFFFLFFFFGFMVCVGARGGPMPSVVRRLRGCVVALASSLLGGCLSSATPPPLPPYPLREMTWKCRCIKLSVPRLVFRETCRFVSSFV